MLKLSHSNAVFQAKAIGIYPGKIDLQLISVKGEKAVEELADRL